MAEPTFRKRRSQKAAPGPGSLALVNAFGRSRISFPGSWVEIPPGAFRMSGSDSPEKVTITRPFKLLSVPMTQGFYRHLMGENPSRFDGSALPVEQVRWLDAAKCCNALSPSLGAS